MTASELTNLLLGAIFVVMFFGTVTVRDWLAGIYRRLDRIPKLPKEP